MIRKVSSHRRIVIKIGSALLVDQKDGLRRVWMESLLNDVAGLVNDGKEVLLVSSGAIALGRRELDSELGAGQLQLRESQAAAAVGQIALSRVYAETLGSLGLKAGQVLLTLGDTETRKRYLNARATIETLIKWDAIPIINENDTVATSEIRYGDNDRLAARVASMVGADLLILLSDVDGLYTASPDKDPNAQHIGVVESVTAEIEAMAGEAASEFSKGGMKTKVEAAKIATTAGTTMVIASGKMNNPIASIDEDALSTWFAPSLNPINQRKKWIAAGLEASGEITIDSGALIALESGKSLLPAGVTYVDGQFDRGDTVEILGPTGIKIGRGLIQFNSTEASKIVGLKSSQIEKFLGADVPTSMVHRDDMVLTDT